MSGKETNQADYLSEPYEAWATNPLVEIELKAEQHRHRLRRVFRWLMLLLVVMVMVALAFAKYVRGMDSWFIPSFDFTSFAYGMAIAASLLLTLFLIICRIYRITESSWAAVICCLPAGLFVSALVLTPAIYAVAHYWVLRSVEPVPGQITLYQSEPGRVRGCLIRNQYVVNKSEYGGFWCGSKKLKTGDYPVQVKESEFGVVVLYNSYQDIMEM